MLSIGQPLSYLMSPRLPLSEAEDMGKGLVFAVNGKIQNLNLTTSAIVAIALHMREMYLGRPCSVAHCILPCQSDPPINRGASDAGSGPPPIHRSVNRAD